MNERMMVYWKEMRPFLLFLTMLALVAVALMPLAIALGQEASPDRILPDAVHRGETFDVIVTFTAPANELNAVGFTDVAPDGWDVPRNDRRGGASQ
jgi:hypothetical protein